MPILSYFKSPRIVPGQELHLRSGRSTWDWKDPALKELEEYLKLSKSCVERAQKISSSASVKFNHGQCKYLAAKLKDAVKGADSFLALLKNRCFWFPSPEDKVCCLNILKLLYSSAKEVEDFIHSQTSKDAWVHAAMLTNVSEYVSSTGFNLELWALVFPKDEELGARRSFTLTEVDAIFKAEVENVKEKASGDRDMSLRNANAVLHTEKPNSREYQQAALLLARLMDSKLIPASSSQSKTHFGSKQLEETVSTSLDSLKRMEQLGKGAAGTVFRAMWLGGEVALKTFQGSNNHEFDQEVLNLRKLSHPNIISLLGSTKNDRECSIIMEKMDGDLSWLMEKRQEERHLEAGVPPFELLEGVDLMLQVGGGMHYLHDKKIVHRDLKSMNILVRRVRVQDRGREVEYVVAKVSDFGLSKTKETSRTYSTQSCNMGTTKWMAPEVMQPRRHVESEAKESPNFPFKSDIYSFGMVCYEILTGDTPFSKMSGSEVRNFVLNDDGRPPIPSQCPLLLKWLIRRCWSRDPSKRPGSGEICAELRHIKCLLLMPAPLVEVNSLSVNIPERPSGSSSARNSSTPIGFKGRGRHVEWLVALDFGTIYSGFAYAKVTNGDQVFLNSDYSYYSGEWTPRGKSSRQGAEESPYCKVLTASFYRRGLSRGQPGRGVWGYHAQHEYLANVEGLYLTELKNKTYVSKFLANLPSWVASRYGQLTVKSITTDYLKYIGELALTTIKTRPDQSKDANFDRDSVLWCVLVPSTWDESAKQQMGAYMVDVGLVSGDGGPESVMFVQEPEAASFHCHQLLISNHRLNASLHVRDKILVVDMGGRSVDVVVQEVVRTGNNFTVHALTKPLADNSCGGASVDESFIKFMSRRIGFLDEFLREDVRCRWRLLMEWEEIKCGFGHETMSVTDTVSIALHNILAEKWKAYEMENGYPRRESYSKIELTEQDLKSIFDPVVVKILGLIGAQLMRVHDDVRVMFAVGGFASSPYLMQKIRARFSDEIRYIFCPPDPGSAIMRGAIGLALTPDAIARAATPDAIMPRILKKTYGITKLLPFEHGVDPGQFLQVRNGKHYCRNRFSPIFQKDSRIDQSALVQISSPFHVPHIRGQTQILVDLYSSSELEPRYTEQASVAKEGNFVINLLECSNYIPLVDADEVEVTFKFTLHLGRNRVELRAAATVIADQYGEEPHAMELPQVFPLHSEFDGIANF